MQNVIFRLDQGKRVDENYQQVIFNECCLVSRNRNLGFSSIAMPNEISLMARLKACRGMSLRVRVNILTADVNRLANNTVIVIVAV